MVDASAPGILVACPNCRASTPSLKHYSTAEWFVFVGLFFWWRSVFYTACPACMRGLILKRLVYNIVPANVTMVILGPVYLGQVAATFLPGHSKAIRKGIAAQHADVEAEEQRRLAAAETELASLAQRLGPVVASLRPDATRADVTVRLLAIAGWFTPGGPGHVTVTDFRTWLEAGDFGALRALFVPAQPPVLRQPLLDILEVYVQLPDE
jgi:hypothetical protein